MVALSSARREGAPQQVDRFLEAWVEPVLARYQNDAGARVGAPEVRV